MHGQCHARNFASVTTYGLDRSMISYIIAPYDKNLIDHTEPPPYHDARNDSTPHNG